MARSKIVANMYELDKGEPKDRLQLMKEDLERANDRKELAYFIRGHIRKMYEEAQNININIGNRERNIKDFEERLAKLGIVWDSSKDGWEEASRVRDEIGLLNKNIDFYTLQKMKQLSRQLDDTVDMIERIKKKNET